MEIKSYSAKPGEVERKWYIIDASGKVLGRLATEIAHMLRGKDHPTYTPNADTGDFVVVVNAEKIEMTGKKWDVKRYYRHTGWFGGIKSLTAKELREKDPGFIITEAVRGMLPKNKQSRQLILKLKVYAGTEHPHDAQKPEVYTPREAGLNG